MGKPTIFPFDNISRVQDLLADKENLVDANKIRSRLKTRRASAKPARVVNFAQYLTGERPANVTLVGSATAVINSDRMLEVVSNYQSGNRVFISEYFAEGTLTFCFRRGTFMLKITPDEENGTQSKAFWSSDAVLVSYGNIDTAGNIISHAFSLTAVPAGSATDNVIIEYKAGNARVGTPFEIRVWLEGTDRPASATIGGTHADTSDHEVNQGRIELCTFDDPAKFKYITLTDGTKGNAPALAFADFVGPWFPSYLNGVQCMSTVTEGSMFRFVVSGVVGVTCRYSATYGIVDPALSPYADIFISEEGEMYGTEGYFSTITFPGFSSGFNALGANNFINSLDPSKTYYCEVRIRGLNSENFRYQYGAGLAIADLQTVDADGNASGYIKPWDLEGPGAVFVGDSVTASIVARNYPAIPANSAGDQCWPILISKLKGFRPIVCGIGGLGVNNSGVGGWPAARLSVLYRMHGRKIDKDRENIQYVFICFGPNDAAAGTSSADFKLYMKDIIKQLLFEFPGIQKVYLIKSFSNLYGTALTELEAEFNDNRLQLIDTDGWGITFALSGGVSDGTHPDLASQYTIANKLDELISIAQAQA